jgi:hypothetical protein
LGAKLFDVYIGSWRGETIVLMERIDFRILALRASCRTSRRSSFRRHGVKSENVI